MQPAARVLAFLSPAAEKAMFKKTRGKSPELSRLCLRILSTPSATSLPVEMR